jgi:hypothetical protein
MGSYEINVLRRLKAQCPGHVELLFSRGFEWNPDLPIFRKSTRGGLPVDYSPERLAEMSLDKLKSELGAE